MHDSNIAALVSGPAVLWEPIFDQAVSNVAQVDIIWAGDYEAVFIDFANVRPVNDGAGLLLRFSSDGGATFHAGASEYEFFHSGWFINQNTSLGPNTFIPMAQADGVGNVAGEEIHCSLILPRPFDASEKTQVIGRGGQTGIALNPGSLNFYGFRDAASRVDGVRFAFGTGNISAGRFAASGLRRQ